MEFSEFRRHAHRVVDWMTDYLETLDERAVRPSVQPGELLAKLPASCPEVPEPFETIFEDFQSDVLPGITHWQHPRFFAYFPANSSPPSILAEMLTATLAAQCMLWETSPAGHELEVRVLEWLRELIGLPKAFTGSIQDSGSAANLCAMIAARERATGGTVSTGGLCRVPRLTVYASAEAHSSVTKAATIAGIGAKNVRKIPVDRNFALQPEALAQAIRADRGAGCQPACIVACLGATGLGSVDPLPAIGRIARDEKVYLHVDAAWAGSALILPKYRHYLDGIDAVDSFVLNPHKWLFTNFDCATLYLRYPDELANALAITPTYLESAPSESLPEFRNMSIALARRFRALKLWFVLRSYGARGLRKKVQDHIDWTAALARRIRETENFELVTEPRFALLAFRFRPDAPEGALDRINEELLCRINDDGRIYLTKARANGDLVLRFSIGQTYTAWKHVVQGWAVVVETANSLDVADIDASNRC